MTFWKQPAFYIPAILVAILIIILAASAPRDGAYDYDDYYGYESVGLSTGGPLVAADSFLAYDEVAQSAPRSNVSAIEVEEAEYIIKTGELDIQVDDAQETVDELTRIAETYGGDVQSRSLDVYNEVTSGYVTLRVEEDSFEAALDEVRAIASSVRYEIVDNEDVTDQVVDIEARLSNAQAEEQSYLSVLSQATDVEDILLVHDYLSDVRETIERYTAQLEYLQSRSTYSTITVYLTEDVSIVLDSDRFQPGKAATEAVQTVVRIFQSAVITIIWVIIVGVAIAVPLLILWWIVRKLYNRFKK